jgi:hypothetical protein
MVIALARTVHDMQQAERGDVSGDPCTRVKSALSRTTLDWGSMRGCITKCFAK